MIKKLAITGLILIALPFALFGAYYLYSAQEVKSKINSLSSNAKPVRVQFDLQSDSQVYYKDFEDFIKLSMAKSDQDVTKISSRRKGKLNFTQDISFSGQTASSCEFNCLHIKVNFDELSSLLWKGLVGIEDYRFFDHEGVDYKSILRAVLVDLKAMKIVQGGSTLTQQLVKNLFLTSEKKISRKLKELIYASYIEDKLSKDQIIMLYFNNVYWGSFQGIKLKGVQAASLAYFNKRASDLTSFESIILIGMLKGPYYYSPFKNLDRLKSRIDVVFKRLSQLKLIGAKSKWSDKQWSNWHRILKVRNEGTSFRSFIQVKSNSLLNIFEEFALYQSIAKVKKVMSSGFKGRDIGIKILLHSFESKDNKTKDFSFYSKTQRDLKAAISSEHHQVASILKPLIYNYFYINGMSPTDLVQTKKITLNLKSGNWSPKDSSRSSKEYVSLGEALRKSKNIPIVRLSQQAGFEKIQDHLLTYVPRLKLPLKEYPAQILGAVEMSMSEVKEMYKKFLTTNCIENLHNTKTVDILSDSKDSTLRKVATEKFKLLKIFAKTGTSNKAMDNWFIGFDSKELFIIWFGQETDKNNKRLIASGATSSFRVYQDFIFNRGKRINELICK